MCSIYSVDPEFGYETCENYSPVILDLHGDGIATTGRHDPVLFDYDGDGIPEVTAWTAPGAADAFLYLDKNDNRRVDDASELLGTYTMLPTGGQARNGFDALLQYDWPEFGGNSDGVLSQADAIWKRLRLWVDWNHNGLDETGEDFTLASQGVVQLSLTYYVAQAADNHGADAQGNFHKYQGNFTKHLTTVGEGKKEMRFAANDIFFLVQR